MKDFLKENSILIIGISLPLLIAILFYASIQISTMSTDSPAHSIIFTSGSYSYSPYKIIVENRQVKMKFTPPEGDKYKNRRILPKPPELYVFDPKTGKSRRVNIPEIEENNWSKEIILPIEELQNFKISPEHESPDGYNFKRADRGDFNLMTEMFGGGYRSRQSYYLEKNSRKIFVPEANRYHTEFVGWIIEERK